MSLDGISNKVGVSSLEGPEVDMRSAARDLNKPTKRYEENAVSGFGLRDRDLSCQSRMVKE